jgi:hypothetical protein
MQVSWKDGRLAAKQLFDSLRSLGIQPETQSYGNAFHNGFERIHVPKAWLRRTLRRAISRKETVVAMGQRVHALLLTMGVAHIEIVHPAARGRIRKKSRYTRHLKERLRP